MKIQIDSHELQRQVEMAFLLEVTIPKEECTSRFRDIGPKQKFEYFLISAINSGKYFFELGERINETQGQPEVFYDLAYQALIDSQKSRNGKIVNHGLLEIMFPVVVSRCLLDKEGLEVLKTVPNVLKDTSNEDVRYVAEMRRKIYLASDKQFKRDFPFHAFGDNVLEHYEHHKIVAHQASKLFVSELTEGMPLTKMMYQSLTTDKGNLTERLNEGFNQARSLSELPYGALADFSAAALFLLISENPKSSII
ncbi:MAG: triphosphoribosyl-dephospho-CoA synthase [Nanoarchaeota archaeon]|nr:triphosphoribosyl-dephospho-CoA synthase [Nanoarchaeota archaeon]